MSRTLAANHLMIAATAADRLFRRRSGTCRGLWLAGAIRGRERPGKGRTGTVLELSQTDLANVLGDRLLTKRRAP